MKSTSDWERTTMQDSYARDHRIEFLQIDDRTKRALGRDCESLKREVAAFAGKMKMT